ncbi:gas vesicle protein GvpJ [Streptomyces sp. NPDC006632]|uniref:gas vesicle protein GvpJ n=1 Tax=unclassified Streptomyces TaxID=2593676 RepID=UPI002E1BC299
MPATTYSDEVVACPPRAGTLYDVLELILDRGMVIDVFVRVSLVGIEILKIDARIVVASVDTYLRFAEACNRLDLERDSGSTTIPELLGGGAAGAAKSMGKRKVREAAHSVGDTVRKAVRGRDDDADETDEDEEERREPTRKRRPAPRSGGSSSSRRRTAEA